jgi:undecaprenyl-diphosphatase
MNAVSAAQLLLELLKLTVYISCAYLALMVYAHRIKTGWVVRFVDRRFVALALLTLAIVGIKVFEDVVTKESATIDAALLWFVRQTMPPAVVGFFALVTLAGAAKVLVPVTAVLSIALFITRHRQQAYLLVGSMASGWAFTYVVKSLVNRARPDLWSTTWYWGSSFPSGHTLSTAAFSTALVIGAAQIWPRSRYYTLPLAGVWIVLMGMSRLVLGVHWPTDVLAATCLGVFIPLVISIWMDSYQRPTGTDQ